MKIRKSKVVWEETFTGGNAVWEVILFGVFICGILSEYLMDYPIAYYGICGGIALVWVATYIRFRRHSQIGFVKCCSFQLIVCGLLGAALMAIVNQFFVKNAFVYNVLTLVLLGIMVGINHLRHEGTHTVYYLTFLLFPYCLLSVNLFLVTSFLSAFLLLLGLFTGTLFFENQRLEEDEYFGNSNHAE